MRKIILVTLLLSLCLFEGAKLQANNSMWQDWFKKKLIFALVDLSNMRKRLNKNNLYDPNTNPKIFVCGVESLHARTADGSCNDQTVPWMGAAGTRFGRNVKLSEGYPDTVGAGLLEPNPRTVSLELLTRNEFKPVPYLNLFAVSWIQFMVHDWVSHGENNPSIDASSAFFLPLGPNDPFDQGLGHSGFMTILGTSSDPTRTAEDNQKLPPTYINEVSSWWDGSQVYGSDMETQRKLRTFTNGKMRIDDDGHLPIDDDDIEIAGFKRNWWLGLSMLHHVFVKEHNRIADMLLRTYPEWCDKNHVNSCDQKLFDVSRLINVAIMAKIHTVEWTPAILNNHILRTAMKANWYGLINHTGAVRPWWQLFKNPAIDGLVGGHRNIHGVPYSLTEEFTSVYRLHSFLPESMTITSFDTRVAGKTIPLADTRLERSHVLSHEIPMNDIIYSMGITNPGQLVLNNYPQFMQNLAIPVIGKIDMGTADIFRDRERGVPRYNRFRRDIGLVPIKSFDDLTDDKSVVEKLRKVYGTKNGSDNVEALDLLVGTLGEGHRPDGFAFGETMFQIFILNASRRLQSDRFFTDDYNAATYSEEGLSWINHATFKTVMLDAYPEMVNVMKDLPTGFSAWSK